MAETSLDDRDLALFKVPREDNYEIAKIQIYQVSDVAHGPLVNKRVLKLWNEYQDSVTTDLDSKIICSAVFWYSSKLLPYEEMRPLDLHTFIFIIIWYLMQCFFHNNYRFMICQFKKKIMYIKRQSTLILLFSFD